MISMSLLVYGFQDIDNTKIMLVGIRAPGWEHLPELMEYAYRMASVFLTEALKESLGNRRR